MTALSANDDTHHVPDPEVEAIIRSHADWAGGLMPALHAVQHHAGYIDPSHIPLLARTFNLSVAEVHGVISFYKDFRTTAPRGPIVQVCRAEACVARGGRAVEARAIELAATEAVEIEEVFCLGLCAQGPAAASGGELFDLGPLVAGVLFGGGGAQIESCSHGAMSAAGAAGALRGRFLCVGPTVVGTR